MRLLLASTGHARAEGLHALGACRVAGLEITLVTAHLLTPYSGMVPGWPASHYRWKECCIDFLALCQRTGAKLVNDSVAGTVTDNRDAVPASGRRLGFDRLSLYIGSEALLPMRPLSDLHERWTALLDGAARRLIRRLGVRMCAPYHPLPGDTGAGWRSDQRIPRCAGGRDGAPGHRKRIGFIPCRHPFWPCRVASASTLHT